MVKISLRKKLIIGGLLAILGCSEKKEPYTPSTPEKPASQEKGTEQAQPPLQPSRPEKYVQPTQTRQAYEIVYFYDTNKIEKHGEGVEGDPELSLLCNNYGFSLFTIASNAELAKKEFKLADKPVIMICKDIIELERFLVTDRQQLASRLEQELRYHTGKGTPPAGCKDYQKK